MAKVASQGGMLKLAVGAAGDNTGRFDKVMQGLQDNRYLAGGLGLGMLAGGLVGSQKGLGLGLLTGGLLAGGGWLLNKAGQSDQKGMGFMDRIKALGQGMSAYQNYKSLDPSVQKSLASQYGGGLNTGMIDQMNTYFSQPEGVRSFMADKEQMNTMNNILRYKGKGSDDLTVYDSSQDNVQKNMTRLTETQDMFKGVGKNEAGLSQLADDIMGYNTNSDEFMKSPDSMKPLDPNAGWGGNIANRFQRGTFLSKFSPRYKDKSREEVLTSLRGLGSGGGGDITEEQGHEILGMNESVHGQMGDILGRYSNYQAPSSQVAGAGAGGTAPAVVAPAGGSPSGGSGPGASGSSSGSTTTSGSP
jgi:hypothetical protein